MEMQRWMKTEGWNLKNKVGRFPLPDIKIYFKTVVVNAVQY